MHPQEEEVFKDCHVHMFLEEPAAFALADVYVGRDIVESDVLAVIILDKGDDVLKPLQMFLGALFFFGEAGKVMVQFLEDLHEYDMDRKLVVCRFFCRQMVKGFYLAEDFLVPSHMLLEFQGRPVVI